MHRDHDLLALLTAEVRKHLAAIEDALDGSRESEVVRRALHSLKGSAGLVGEHGLADEAGRLERRARSGIDASAQTIALLQGAAERLSRGEPAVPEWPLPPPLLVPTPIDPALRAEYATEVADRLLEIDRVLGQPGGPVGGAAAAYRHVHTLKGAASAANDEPMSWFCHGLEEVLRDARDEASARRALGLMLEYRGVLGALVDDPARALEMLSGSREREVRSKRRLASSIPPRGSRLDEDPRFPSEEATVRVEATSIERLFRAIAEVGLASDRLSPRASRIVEEAQRVRAIRADLIHALRLIGPSTPWGAPAAALARIDGGAQALGRTADALDDAAGHLRVGAAALGDEAALVKRELASMRQTPIKKLFARLGSAVEAEARRAGRSVSVRTTGDAEAVDRLLLEALAEPCMQIARNAVAHGIEPPEVRRAAGKRETGTVSLSARRHGSRLRVTIADDGAGVDVAALRRLALETRTLSGNEAAEADDDALLGLLFVPGFSTRESSDLLAGRGIGLDIALGSIQRLGGTLRLSSRRHRGFAARVEVAAEGGLAAVLFVVSEGVRYAVPTASTGRVGFARTGPGPGGTPLSLAAVLGGAGRDESAPPPRLSLELVRYDDEDGAKEVAIVGIDEAARIADAFVRPLSPLLSGLGPFSGAVADDDGRPVLTLDADGVVARIRRRG